MRFELVITLGNAAMQDGSDVADALRTVAVIVAGYGDLAVGDDGRIRDVNGNTVGYWSVEA